MAKISKIEMPELTSGSRREIVQKAGKEVTQIGVKKLGLSGAEIAQYLGVTASCINRIAGQGEMSSGWEIILKSFNE